MSTPFAFHSDLGIARYLPRAIFTRRTLPLVRFAYDILARLTPDQGAEKVTLASGQRLYLHRPATPVTSPTPALLWIHGGGMVIGDPRLEAQFCAELANVLGIVVVAPAYRRAPMFAYPAALDDVDAALTWLAALPGIDPARIAIGGDSAGGGLAACLAIHATARPGPKPCFQLLHEPMLDAATCHRPDPDPHRLRMWSAKTNRIAWAAYLGDHTGPIPATAAAAEISEADAARLPPAWLGIGSADLFYDEGVAYAAKLTAAGVATSFHPVEGAFHSFVAFAPKAPVSRAYVAEMTRALAQGLALPPAPDA